VMQGQWTLDSTCAMTGHLMSPACVLLWAKSLYADPKPAAEQMQLLLQQTKLLSNCMPPC
jgi:hypothetical protein